MSRRIAHRPRYRSMQQLVKPIQSSRRSFFRTRWSYKQQRYIYEKHALGYRVACMSHHELLKKFTKLHFA